jgi:hypothetical protein
MNPSFPAVGTADSVFITFEPEADSDPLPSNARILEASSLLSGGGSLTFPAFDLTTAAGSFGLRSPSNNALGTPADDESGVSFMSDSLQPLLALPILTAGWTYEGWVEDRNTGRLFSTGRFQDPAAPDSDSMIDLARGAGFIPGFPSRDFVNAVPTLTLNAAFPGSITEIMVTIEATPDAEIGPSPMLLLSGVVPAGATGGGVAVQVNSLTNQVVTGASLNYSGTLSINR